MDLVPIARESFEAVLKDKGWAPGPNAGWKRIGLDDPDITGGMSDRSTPRLDAWHHSQTASTPGERAHAAAEYERLANEEEGQDGRSAESKSPDDIRHRAWERATEDRQRLGLKPVPEDQVDQLEALARSGEPAPSGDRITPEYLRGQIAQNENAIKSWYGFGEQPGTESGDDAVATLWARNDVYRQVLDRLGEAAQGGRTAVADYLGQTIDYGGEEMTIGEVMADLRTLPQWTQEMENAYIAGALTAKHRREGVHKLIPFLIPVEKSGEPERRITLGVVLEPGTEDEQGDVMTPEDIEKAAHQWMIDSQAAGDMHRSVVKGAKPVESYIAPCDFTVETADGPEKVLQGSWLLAMRWPEEQWEKVKKGEYTGYSVGGQGVRTPLERVDKAGRGRMGGPLAAGPDGACVCPSCGHREAHDAGEPCTDLACPECGTMMVREEVDGRVLKDKGWAPGPNAGWRRIVGDEEEASPSDPIAEMENKLRAANSAKPDRFKNVAGQMLLPASLEAKLPALYSQENIDDPVIVAHFFNPAGQGDWYIYEGQREEDDYTMFGWGGVGDPDDYELGYSSLAEMAAVRGPLGIGIERDKFWQPAPLSQVKDRAKPREKRREGSL
ncbi:MAG: DUF2958 domain-containing protein [Thermoleophilia bacterium]|nr:DUF2958 domain-containing protein [Thermoleophilia bacterium]